MYRVLQGWMFYNDQFWADTERAKSFLTSVPTVNNASLWSRVPGNLFSNTVTRIMLFLQGKIIVLDLQSEQFPQFARLKQYFGQPYIWCMLHNFGGTLGMHGSANTINNVN